MPVGFPRVRSVTEGTDAAAPFGVILEVAVTDTRFAVVWEELAGVEDGDGAGAGVVVARSDRVIVHDAHNPTQFHVGRVTTGASAGAVMSQNPGTEHSVLSFFWRSSPQDTHDLNQDMCTKALTVT